MFEVRLFHFDIQFLIPNDGLLHQFVVSLNASGRGDFHESRNLLPCVAAAFQAEEQIVIIGGPLTFLFRWGTVFELVIRKDLALSYVDLNWASGHICQCRHKMAMRTMQKYMNWL